MSNKSGGSFGKPKRKAIHWVFSFVSREVLQLIILLNLCKRLTGKIQQFTLAYNNISARLMLVPIIIKRGEGCK